LLEDAAARLRAQGVRVLLLRAKPGERQIDYAFTSDLAAALCAQPGAAGISPATAGTLVGLNPALSSRFRGPPDRTTGAEAFRRRAIALCETIATVADDHAMAILLDDLHWSDPVSRRVLGVIIERLPRHRVQVVTAARTGVEESWGEFGRKLSLQALSREEVGALIASLGALPEAPWAVRLPCLLHQATGGIPLLLLDSLAWLIQRDVLLRSERVWSCTDPDRLEAELVAGSALRRRLADLERKPAWVLLLLAEAGTPIPLEQIARMAELPVVEVEAVLATLELRGLARRVALEWEPAHDEIATAAREQASAEAIRAANAAVGRVLAEIAGEDAQLLFKAGRHLAVADEYAALGEVFRRWFLVARRQRERRSARVLAAELLGNSRTGERVDTLVKTIPLHVRLGLTTARRMAVAAAVPLALAAAGAAFLLKAPAPPPDALLVLYYRGGGDSLHAVTVPVNREGWIASDPIDVGRAGSPYSVLRLAGNRGDLAPSPDGTQWAFSRLVPESSAFKLFLVGSDGESRELTDSIRDDQDPSWSPDGGSLVFSTARWNTNRWGDLATIDLASRRVRRLTTDPRTEDDARWSPDGTRIAYQWHAEDARHSRICWTTPAGDAPVCLPLDGAGILGWYDPNTLLIRFDSAGESVLARYNLETRESQPVWHGKANDLVISGDGRWVACRCQAQGNAETTWIVFPEDRPDLARPLLGGALEDARVYAFWADTKLPTFIARLEITAPTDSIPLGTLFQLHIRGRDSSGNAIAVPVLTWHSVDTTVATVDELTGLVRPVREGNLTIVATAGGWRHTQRRFVIVPPASHVVLTETWTDMRQWVAYGDPKPTLTLGPEGARAFWNDGDGWNMSGAHSNRSFRAARGLGIEARLSTPLVGPRQQFVRLSLAAWMDSTAVFRRDQSVDNSPTPEFACLIHYPEGGGDNPATWDYMGTGGGSFPAPGLRSGAWNTIRLQLFPDGRCGVAVNGKALALEDASLPLNLPYYAVLEGNSVGNRMLVGPVEVWEGVRDDVDWSHAEQGNSSSRRQRLSK
jgi:Big-like domain-containing protein/WD40 repeat protein